MSVECREARFPQRGNHLKPYGNALTDAGHLQPLCQGDQGDQGDQDTPQEREERVRERESSFSLWKLPTLVTLVTLTEGLR